MKLQELNQNSCYNMAFHCILVTKLHQKVYVFTPINPQVPKISTESHQIHGKENVQKGPHKYIILSSPKHTDPRLAGPHHTKNQ